KVAYQVESLTSQVASKDGVIEVLKANMVELEAQVAAQTTGDSVESTSQKALDRIRELEGLVQNWKDAFNSEHKKNEQLNFELAQMQTTSQVEVEPEPVEEVDDHGYDDAAIAQQQAAAADPYAGEEPEPTQEELDQMYQDLKEGKIFVPDAEGNPTK